MSISLCYLFSLSFIEVSSIIQPCYREHDRCICKQLSPDKESITQKIGRNSVCLLRYPVWPHIRSLRGDERMPLCHEDDGCTRETRSVTSQSLEDRDNQRLKKVEEEGNNVPHIKKQDTNERISVLRQTLLSRIKMVSDVLFSGFL